MSTRKNKQLRDAAGRIRIPDLANLKAAIDRLPRHDLSPWSSDLLIENYHYMIVPDPDEYEPSANETAKQLKRIETGAWSLFESLARLQGPGGNALRVSMKSIEDPPVWSDGLLLSGPLPDLTEAELQALLRRLSEAAEKAQKNLPDDRKGPVPLARARRVAAQAADDFYRITFRPPTLVVNWKNHVTGGPFLDFLKEVFAALEIKAKAERFAKEAIKNWRATPGADSKLALTSAAKTSPRPGSRRARSTKDK